MKYCGNCRQPLDDRAVYCHRCGRSLVAGGENPNDTGSHGWGVLGFFIPIVGLILYLVWRNEQPNNARRAGVGALVSVILNVVFSILIFIIMVAVGSGLMI